MNFSKFKRKTLLYVRFYVKNIFSYSTFFLFTVESLKKVLLHNGGFCNGCITKRILLLQDLLSKKTNIMQIMAKNIPIFINLIFYHRENVKLVHFTALSLSYANTVLWRRSCKIHRFVAAPSKRGCVVLFFLHLAHFLKKLFLLFFVQLCQIIIYNISLVPPSLRLRGCVRGPNF
jgi:hypothetical protein